VIGYKEPLFLKMFNRIVNKITPFFLIKEYLFYDVFHKKHKSRIKWLNKHISSDTDVIIVGWISTFIELTDLLEIQKRVNASVYIHLVDMSLLTGGCHYSYGCDGYTKECLLCPGAVNTVSQREVRNRFIRDSHAIDVLNAKVFAPIEFVLNQAKKSSKPFSGYIRNDLSIDHDIFRYKDKKSILTEKIIFIGAYNTCDYRKGYLTLSNAISLLSQKLISTNYTVKILVPNIEQFSNLVHSNITLKPYDFANNDKSLAALYQMSDVFVNTSIDDTGPAMPIEALMCGIPVICTNTGVAEELLGNHPEFGRLVEVYDSEHIAEALFEILFSCDSKISPSYRIEELFKKKNKNNLTLAESLRQDLYE